MFKFKQPNKKMFLICFVIILSLSLAGPALGEMGDVAFMDDFNDGELDNNPPWEVTYDAWYIENGELNSDGVDNQSRWRNFYKSSGQAYQVDEYLELSYQGLLKSEGNPQEGRGILAALGNVNTPNGDNYQLCIQEGYTSGWPTNQHSISLSYGNRTFFRDLIASDFSPEHDRMYDIRAVREDGIWTLFADGTAIGSAPDPFGLTEINNIVIVTVGSVVIDNFVLKANPTSLPVVVDIKPDDDVNAINPGNKGKLPVAVLTNDTFDAAIVDPATLILAAEDGIGASPSHFALEDVDGDGDVDMILHFKTQDIGVECGDTELYLTGQTVSGSAITGQDLIQTVGCK